MYVSLLISHCFGWLVGFVIVVIFELFLFLYIIVVPECIFDIFLIIVKTIIRLYLYWFQILKYSEINSSYFNRKFRPFLKVRVLVYSYNFRFISNVVNILAIIDIMWNIPITYTLYSRFFKTIIKQYLVFYFTKGFVIVWLFS